MLLLICDRDGLSQEESNSRKEQEIRRKPESKDPQHEDKTHAREIKEKFSNDLNNLLLGCPIPAICQWFQGKLFFKCECYNLGGGVGQRSCWAHILRSTKNCQNFPSSYLNNDVYWKHLQCRATSFHTLYLKGNVYCLCVIIPFMGLLVVWLTECARTYFVKFIFCYIMKVWKAGQ